MDLTVSENLLMSVKELTVLSIEKPWVYQSADMKEFLYDDVAVPTATVDLLIPLGKVTTGKILYIESDQVIKIKLNSNSNTELAVSKFILLHSDFTSLYVSNVSGAGATLRLLILGV